MEGQPAYQEKGIHDMEAFAGMEENGSAMALAIELFHLSVASELMLANEYLHMILIDVNIHRS